MKHLNDSIYSAGHLKIFKCNNCFKAIISPFCGSTRRYKSTTDCFNPEISSESDPFQHWFKNWKYLRRNKLTASTFGLAVGFWPQGRVRLWLEKIGGIEPFSGNLATRWSNTMEEEALVRYKLLTGNFLTYPDFQVKQNHEDSWLGASPDGTIDRRTNDRHSLVYDLPSNLDYDLPSKGVLEIKCPYFRGDMSKADPYKRIPLHYMPQAQGLMEILDRDWMDMYIWTINGSSLFRIYRSREYWNILKIALSDFWWKHVQPAKEIYNRGGITDPLLELSSFRPASKHELYRTIICESKLLVDDTKLLMREIHGKRQS